jgi:hypothetical protein
MAKPDRLSFSPTAPGTQPAPVFLNEAKDPFLLLTGAGENGSQVLIWKSEFYSAASRPGGKTMVRLRDGSSEHVAEPPGEILKRLRD